MAKKSVIHVPLQRNKSTKKILKQVVVAVYFSKQRTYNYFFQIIVSQLRNQFL